MISVLDFRADDVSKAHVSTIAGLLAGALVEFGHFRGLECSRRDQLLQEIERSLGTDSYNALIDACPELARRLAD